MSRHGWSVAVFHHYSFQQPGSVPITSSTFPGPQIYMQIVRLIFFYFYPYFLFPSSVCVLWCSKHQVKNSKYCFYINRFCNMCIHPCCCVLLLCNFHHLCNAPGDKNAAKQAAHLISCNWLPFYRPCSFASQTFICFADFHIRAFKIIQKKLILLYSLAPLYTRKTSPL